MIRLPKYNFYEYDDIKIILSFIILSGICFITFTILSWWKFSIISGMLLLCMLILHLAHEHFILMTRLIEKNGGKIKCMKLENLKETKL